MPRACVFPPPMHTIVLSSEPSTGRGKQWLEAVVLERGRGAQPRPRGAQRRVHVAPPRDPGDEDQEVDLGEGGTRRRLNATTLDQHTENPNVLRGTSVSVCDCHVP